jgi:hypothetical protein
VTHTWINNSFVEKHNRGRNPACTSTCRLARPRRAAGADWSHGAGGASRDFFWLDPPGPSRTQPVVEVRPGPGVVGLVVGVGGWGS